MSPLSRTKKLVLVGATAIGVTAGAAGLVGAATSPDSSQPQASAQQASAQADDNTQDPSYTSSVTAPEQKGQNEADESAALQSLAKITPDQARDAALAKVPGTAAKVQLENENGNVVYSVEITDASGATIDVKVDAGNGSVLHQDTGQDDASEGAETSESQEAPEAPAGK